MVRTDLQHQPCSTHRGPGIKQWRLILRNLAFDTKQEDIEEWASAHGNILEIVLPKCKDKRFPNSCAGFCFIQFGRRNDAEKAREELNFKKLKGRKVAVDWAMDKDAWVTKQQEGKEKFKPEVKEEIKEEVEDDEIDSEEGETDLTKKPKDEPEKDEGKGKKKRKTKNKNTKDEPESEEEGEGKQREQAKKKRIFDAKKEKPSEDSAVSEGKVAFIRNVPFSATDQSIRELASQFGEVSLAILCKSADTGEPRGTAFVHFKEREFADAFLKHLATEEGLSLDGRKLVGLRAVQKVEAKSFKPQLDKKPMKDKRNLYLLRASLIRPGTEQARGMSEQDSKLRERLIQMARSKLKNLVMFVSPTRLAIHNIPFGYSDSQLRSVCQKAASCSADAITECRIMRQKEGEDERGRPVLGKSRGFGFVTFAEHSHALNCLRQMNNNPKLFSNDRRPIVEFSIENLNALRTKENRLKLSRGEEAEKGKRKSNTGLEKESKSGDPAVARTKQELMSGGRKWLPKKVGEKMRHRDMVTGSQSRRKSFPESKNRAVMKRKKRGSSTGERQLKKARLRSK